MWIRAGAVALAGALLVAGCGSQDSDLGEESSSSISTSSGTDEGSSITSTSTASTSTTRPPSTESSTTSESEAATEPPTSTAIAPEPTTGPPPETRWMVVSVPFDDVLNVRASPGSAHPVVGALGTTEDEVVATGDAMLLEGSVWWRIADPVSGWVNARYLAAAGSTEDVTSAVIAAAGTIPRADTLDELAQQVIETMWLSSDAEGTAIVVQAPGVAGDIGDIVVDVLLAEPDDAVRGVRITVFGQRDAASGPFSLYAVEATALCWRGADEAGLCI